MIQELMIKKIFNIVFFSYIFRFFIDQHFNQIFFITNKKKEKIYNGFFSNKGKIITNKFLYLNYSLLKD